MFTITRLLLPLLDIDTMAALLETCKEAHSAFQPVKLEPQACHNRGLAERCQVDPFYHQQTGWPFELSRLPDWIQKSEPALLALIYKHYPDIDDSLNSRLGQVLSNYQLEQHYGMSRWAELYPIPPCWDGKTFKFKVYIRIAHILLQGVFYCFNIAPFK